MIPSNFRIEILAIRTLLCALGTKGLTVLYYVHTHTSIQSLDNVSHHHLWFNIHLIWYSYKSILFNSFCFFLLRGNVSTVPNLKIFDNRLSYGSWDTQACRDVSITIFCSMVIIDLLCEVYTELISPPHYTAREWTTWQFSSCTGV